MKKSTVFTLTVGAVVATATLLPSFSSTPGVVAMDVLVSSCFGFVDVVDVVI